MLAGDLPDRAAAQRGDRLQHARLEAAADGHRVEAVRGLGTGDRGSGLGYGHGPHLPSDLTLAATPSYSRRSRLAKATGSASPVVAMPSPT